jgi:hypothetical protein
LGSLNRPRPRGRAIRSHPARSSHRTRPA